MPQDATTRSTESAAMTSPTVALWSRRFPAPDSALFAAVLLDINVSQAEDIISVTIASTEEAWEFLFHLDQTVGSMKRSTVPVSQRCINAVRGPVLWSETVTARASALGNEDIFVCSVLSRSFDSPENRMLASSVLSLSRAELALRCLDPELAQRMRVDQAHITRVADLAKRWLSDPRLAGIRTDEPSQRERSRVTRSSRSNRLQPLLELRKLALDPFSKNTEILDSLVDKTRSEHHAELLQLVEATEMQTGRRQELRYGLNGLEMA